MCQLSVFTRLITLWLLVTKHLTVSNFGRLRYLLDSEYWFLNYQFQSGKSVLEIDSSICKNVLISHAYTSKTTKSFMTFYTRFRKYYIPNSSRTCSFLFQRYFNSKAHCSWRQAAVICMACLPCWANRELGMFGKHEFPMKQLRMDLQLISCRSDRKSDEVIKCLGYCCSSARDNYTP